MRPQCDKQNETRLPCQVFWYNSPHGTRQKDSSPRGYRSLRPPDRVLRQRPGRPRRGGKARRQRQAPPGGDARNRWRNRNRPPHRSAPPLFSHLRAEPRSQMPPDSSILTPAMNPFVRNIARITCPAFAESRVSIAFGVPRSSTRFNVHECYRSFRADLSAIPPAGYG